MGADYGQANELELASLASYKA